ncbi:MAG: holo-ACP synthase [Pirellula sp.]|jgi:holo-[acyl-carrier protein] synthase
MSTEEHNPQRPTQDNQSGSHEFYRNMDSGRLLGIGTDIIGCDRIAQMLEKHGESFLQKVFTPREIEYCSARKSAHQHYAGRWAAKEAVLKVLGTGWAKGIQWTDVEVINEASGAPTLLLANRAAEIALAKGIRTVQISISHCKEYATAFAVGVT